MEELASSWRKSSYSDNGGNCVEVANAATDVKVRDTTNRRGVTLAVNAGVWQDFVSGLK